MKSIWLRRWASTCLSLKNLSTRKLSKPSKEYLCLKAKIPATRTNRSARRLTLKPATRKGASARKMRKLPIQANHVYVIPPNAYLLIGNYTFKVVSPRTRRNAQIDLFMASLAAAMGARAVGIILSGLDGDGAQGCKQIKAKGGTTFAQDISA